MTTTQASAPPFYPRKRRMFHLLILLGLCIVNTLLGYTLAPDIVNLAGLPSVKSDGQRLMGAAMTIFISYNFVGFLAASFLSMVPYKQTTYAQRYVKIAFLTMIVVQVGFLVYGLLLATGILHPRMIF
jgi:hypothetical protein